MPFDVAEDELRELFMQFGGVRYCRLVSNPDTGMARGRHTLMYRVISFLHDFLSLMTSLQVLRLYSSMILLQCSIVWKLPVLNHSK